MKKIEIEKFAEILTKKIKSLESEGGLDQRRRAKNCKPVELAVKYLLNYIALEGEDPISVDCEKVNGVIGFKAVFKGGKIKIFK